MEEVLHSLSIIPVSSDMCCIPYCFSTGENVNVTLSTYIVHRRVRAISSWYSSFYRSKTSLLTKLTPISETSIVFYSLARTASALETVTSRPGSISAYVIFPWSMTSAYRPVRPPATHPNLLEKAQSGSERNSYTRSTVSIVFLLISVFHRRAG